MTMRLDTVHILGQGGSLAPMQTYAAPADMGKSSTWWSLVPGDRSYLAATEGTAEDQSRRYGAAFSRGGSADSHLTAGKLAKLRGQSYFAYRNIVFAHAVIERLVMGVLGPDGLKLRAAASEDPSQNRDIEDAFAAWCDRLDYRELLSGPELQHAALRTCLLGGDVLGVPVAGPDGEAKLQLVEPERIGGSRRPSEYAQPHGVVLDAGGRVQKFQVADYDRSSGIVEEITREFDAQACLFFANIARPSQTRGEPALVRILPYLDQIDDALQSTVVAYRNATKIGLATYTQSPAGMQRNLPGRDIAADDGKTQKSVVLPAGPSIWNLGQKDRVEQIKPEHPGQNVPEFIRLLLRVVGAEAGLPLELVLLDYSESNFFSARAARMDADEGFKMWRGRFARRWMTPLLRVWLDLPPVERGINLPRGTIEALRVHGRNGHLWHGPKMPVFDDVKAAVANRIRRESNQATIGMIAEENGLDGEELISELKRYGRLEADVPAPPWTGGGGQTDAASAIASAAAADLNGSAAKA